MGKPCVCVSMPPLGAPCMDITFLAQHCQQVYQMDR